MHHPAIAVVIPAYNEEKHIGDVVRRTRARFDRVLVVDDGSQDSTAAEARTAGAEVIVHQQNRGKGEAIRTGLRYWLDTANPAGREQDRPPSGRRGDLRRGETASAMLRRGEEPEWVLILDADAQHRPEEIDRFVSAIPGSNAKLFVGNRMDDLARMPMIRRVVNRYMSRKISRLCGQAIPDTQCGFRMLHRELIPDFLDGADRFDYETEMLIKASRNGFGINSVPITTVYCDEVSSIHPIRDTIRFFKLMRRYKKL